MIASLYQSGSAAACRLLYAACVHRQPPADGAMRQMAKGKFGGIEPDALRLAVPGEAFAAHQVRDRERVVVGQPHSHSGISIVASWAWNGSRLTATRIMSSPAATACRRAITWSLCAG